MISHIKSYQDKLTKEDIKLLYECLAILYTNQSNYAEALSVYLKYGGAPIGHVNEYPTMQFSLEFPEILSQNCICYHLLSVSEIFKIVHCGILINLPYYLEYYKINVSYQRDKYT